MTGVGGVLDAGGHMKAEYGWGQGGNGSNTSGFSGLPVGKRSGLDGDFVNAGGYRFWWSSSSNDSEVRVQMLAFHIDHIYPQQQFPRDGCAVRCIKRH